MDLIEKLDLFTNINEEKIGTRSIQFFKWWNGFKPGDRVDMVSNDDYINLTSSSGGGNFSGVDKEINIEDETEMEEFKALERDVWNFC